MNEDNLIEIDGVSVSLLHGGKVLVVAYPGIYGLPDKMEVFVRHACMCGHDAVFKLDRLDRLVMGATNYTAHDCGRIFAYFRNAQEDSGILVLTAGFQDGQYLLGI